MNKRFFIILSILLLAAVGIGALIKVLDMYVDVNPYIVEDYCDVTVYTNHKVDITVKIFGPDGAHVRTLYSGTWLNKGDLPWDGTDRFGVRCTPGVYTVVATAFVNSRYTSTKKTFILK